MQLPVSKWTVKFRETEYTGDDWVKLMDMGIFNGDGSLRAGSVMKAIEVFVQEIKDENDKPVQINRNIISTIPPRDLTVLSPEILVRATNLLAGEGSKKNN